MPRQKTSAELREEQNKAAEERRKRQQVTTPAPISENAVSGTRFNPGGSVTRTERNPLTGELVTSQLDRQQAAAFESSGKRKPSNEEFIAQQDPKVLELIKLQNLLRQLRQPQQSMTNNPFQLAKGIGADVAASIP